MTTANETLVLWRAGPAGRGGAEIESDALRPGRVMGSAGWSASTSNWRGSSRPGPLRGWPTRRARARHRGDTVGGLAIGADRPGGGHDHGDGRTADAGGAVRRAPERRGTSTTPVAGAPKARHSWGAH